MGTSTAGDGIHLVGQLTAESDAASCIRHLRAPVAAVTFATRQALACHTDEQDVEEYNMAA